MAGFEGLIRSATSNDTDAILGILETIACAIPLKLDRPGNREKILVCIDRCCRNGYSYVAELDGQIVAFLLADVYGSGRVELPYGGVSKDFRGRGAFSALMSRIKRDGRSISAKVHRDNKSKMADRLKRHGFSYDGENSNAVQTSFTFVGK
jgi:ribosomal protein S18 acetylase RimI-like enzyme